MREEFNEFNELVSIAKAYCQLIDTASDEEVGWLDQLSRLLPQLHAQVATINASLEDLAEPLDSDLDTRFELYSRLHRLLGAQDAYWMEFDVAEDAQSMSGSLADDLTDIYFELKSGLRELDGHSDPRRTLAGWHYGFRMNWGRHVVDAERHLYELTARDQLAV